MKFSLLLLGVGFLLQAATVSRCSGDPAEPAKVVLDIFSGRPNPAWKLSREETSQLLGLLGELPSTEPGWPSSGLGYRGFVVSFQDSQGRVTTVQVYRGTVKRSAGDSSEYFVDKDRKLERWLLETSRSRLSPELYEVVDKEVP